MAWHRIGNSYYSDAEAKAQGAEYFHFLVDICLPGFITYLGVTALSTLLEHHLFFLVHTTTAKLVYIVAGFFIFCIAYSLRKLVIALSVLAVIGIIALCVFGNFLSWLFT